MTVEIWDPAHPNYNQRVRIRVDQPEIELLIEILKTERTLLVGERIALRDLADITEEERDELKAIRRRSKVLARLLKEAYRAQEELDPPEG